MLFGNSLFYFSSQDESVFFGEFTFREKVVHEFEFSCLGPYGLSCDFAPFDLRMFFHYFVKIFWYC